MIWLKIPYPKLREDYAPSVSDFYPGASAAAVPRDEWDFDGEFYTKWFDVDDSSDGVEVESFAAHFKADRKEFDNCGAPIGIQVRDMEKLRGFENSELDNSDGLPAATFLSPEEGFMCNNTFQAIAGITCPKNTKVRYRCLPGVGMIKGRIFTEVHGRSDNEDFHINRIHEAPKLIDENDDFTSEAAIVLNDGVNCGDHPNCGKNKKLTLRTVSGNNGIMAFKAKAAIPGAYNFTYETLHQGKAVVKSRYNNYLNEDLYPSNFEVYPNIKSITPQVGPLSGGTVITIDGTGFITDGLGGTVSVTVGEVDCMIQSITETQILCEVPASDVSTTTKSFADSRQGSFLVNNGQVPTNEAKFENLDYSEAKCQAACERDFSCVAFVVNENGCQIYDYVESLEASTVDTHTLIRSASSSALENFCFTGRGEHYQGSVAVTEQGHACLAGTFCRNENPAEFARPNCVQAYDNRRVECNIPGCSDEHMAQADPCPKKYAGNRGVTTSLHFGESVQHVDNYVSYATPALYSQTFKSPAFHISASRDNFFYGQDGDANNYIAKSEAFFVAPIEGFFSFQIAADDRAELLYDMDQCTESYKKTRTDNNAPSFTSEVKYLAKGEKMHLQTFLFEQDNDDYVVVGVNYHGVDESGTWHDHRDKVNYPTDSYGYHKQEIVVTQDEVGRYHEFTAVVAHNYDDLLAQKDFESGQFWDNDGTYGTFRIKQCGDNGQCFTTSDLDGSATSRSKAREEIQNNWLSTECTLHGRMDPLTYHATFENEKDGMSHGRRNDQGHYCGVYAYRVLADNKVWDYSWNGK